MYVRGIRRGDFSIRRYAPQKPYRTSVVVGPFQVFFELECRDCKQEMETEIKTFYFCFHFPLLV